MSTSVPAAPRGLRYRSARDLGADPSEDPDTLLTEALRLRDDTGFRHEDRETARRMLIGLTQRSDLPGHVLNRLCGIIDGRYEWGAAITLLRSPHYRRQRCVRNLINTDIIPALLPYADEFAEEIVALIGYNPNVVRKGYQGPLVEEARRALGDDQINTVITKWLRPGRNRLSALVRTPLLTEYGWAAALNRLRHPDTKPDDRLILLSLSSAPTITTDRALALIDAYDAIDADDWNYRDLMSNPYCPVEVYERLALHRKSSIALTALANDRCTDAVRFLAARRGRLHGLLKASSAIPTDLAVKVLDDLDRGRAGRRKIQSDEVVQVRNAVAHLTTDPAVTTRVIDMFMAASDTTEAGLNAYWAVASDDWSRWPEPDGETRADDVLRMLAASPDGRIRAFVVGHLSHADDVMGAMTDPAPEVRAAAIRHSRFPEDRLAEFATDPSDLVRAAVGERFLMAMDRPLPTDA